MLVLSLDLDGRLKCELFKGMACISISGLQPGGQASHKILCQGAQLTSLGLSLIAGFISEQLSFSASSSKGFICIFPFSKVINIHYGRI